MTIFDHALPKIIESTLSFPEFVPACKESDQFIPSVQFWDAVNFKVLWSDWSQPFLTKPTLYVFDQLLIFVNLYQKIILLHLFIPQVQSILEPGHKTGHKHFWPGQHLTFSTTFSFSWIYTISYFHQIILEIPSVRVQRPDWSYPYLNIFSLKFQSRLFNQFALEK